MSKADKKLVIFELILILCSLLIGFLVPIFKEFKISFLIMGSIGIFKKLFGFKKEKHKDTKETVIALSVFMITFLIVYYLFGFLIGFTISGTNVLIPIISTIIYILGREFLRYQMITKIKDNHIIMFLSIVLFIILDLSNQAFLLISTDYKPIVMVCTLLFPAISNNIVLTYLSKKSGYLPVMFYAGVMSLYPYIIPLSPNTTMSMNTTLNTIVPILLWVRMSAHFDKKEKRKNTTNDNLMNLSILVFPVVLMMLILYFTSGYFRYESIVIGTNNMSPTIKKGDVVIVDKKGEEEYKVGDVIAYKEENTLLINRVNQKKYKDKQILYYVGENEVVMDQDIMGKVTLRIKYLGWPSLWMREENRD